MKNDTSANEVKEIPVSPQTGDGFTELAALSAISIAAALIIIFGRKHVKL